MAETEIPTSTGTKTGAATRAATYTALVIVTSTRAAQGVYEDRSGVLLVDWLRSRGFHTPDALIVADADAPLAIERLFSGSEPLPRVVLTSGGTGITPDDLTVDALRPHIDKEMPGIVHAFFARGMANTPTAVLSRTAAGVHGKTFIMALPGSRGAAKDGIAVLDPILAHIMQQLDGCHDHS